jgi:hypothetical protein
VEAPRKRQRQTTGQHGTTLGLGWDEANGREVAVGQLERAKRMKS